MQGKLILENGMEFVGEIFGYTEDACGEVVFNTGMTGYQEVLTDPSYSGQVVVMTYPLIGNYGINLEDNQSDSPKVKGFVVRESCSMPNNFRCELELDAYLKHNKITAISGIDTRHLTRVLRDSGTMKGIITKAAMTDAFVKYRLSLIDMSKCVYEVSTPTRYDIKGNGKHVAIIDYGIKQDIINNFVKRGCSVTVFPATVKAEEVMEINPDLVFLSNGPGDPGDLGDAIAEIRKFVEKVPTAGICLGHQLLAISLGGETKKLKFGHRGCNHPVKDMKSGRVYITSQNHGYYVSKVPDNMETTFISLNDGSVEGMRHKNLPIESVQFHPEACPGPVDASGIFDRFLKLAK